MECFTQYKEVNHEKDVKATKVHQTEVKDLKEKIVDLNKEAVDKSRQYENVEQSVLNLKQIFPKLINDKLDLQKALDNEKKEVIQLEIQLDTMERNNANAMMKQK